MLILLITALITLFSGAQGAGAIPDLDKLVKKHVEDKERKSEILAILKLHKKDVKALSKEIKPYKVFWDMTRDYDTQKKDLDSMLNDVRQLRKGLETKGRERTMKIKALIKPEEWTRILNAAEGKIAKIQKKRVKTVKKYDKALASLLTTIKQVVTDPDRIQRIEKVIMDHERSYKSNLKAWNEINYKDHPVLRNQDASEDELADIFDQIDQHRWTYFMIYINDREKLKAELTKSEWNSIIKKYNKLHKE